MLLKPERIVPLAMIFEHTNTKVALGCVVSRCPAVSGLDGLPTELIETGDIVKVDGDNGIVEIQKKT